MDYKVALYIRLSKEDGDKKESESVTNQRAILEEFAKDQRLDVKGIYVDDGFTGANFDRPDFERLTNDIEGGKINMVVVKDLSRFGRNRVRQEYFVCQYSEKYGVRFIAVNDDFDTDDENNELVFMMKNWSNEQFIRDTSKKIKTTKRYKQRQGQFIGGKASYGYKISPDEKNKIIIDNEVADVVKRIFALALDGKSCREIAVILNDEKIPTPSQYAKINVTVNGPYSGKWSSERVTFMLRNEVYIGNMVQGRVQKPSYKTKKCKKLPPDEWTVVEGTHEPIIDTETFYKVQQLIDSRKHTRSRTYEYPLKGLIHCHECGYPLAVLNPKNAKGEDRLYFVCRTYQRFTKEKKCTTHCIGEELVTNAVIGKIREICNKFVNSDELHVACETAIENVEQKYTLEQKIAEYETKTTVLTANLDRMYDDKLSGVLDESDYVRRSEHIRAERQGLQEKIRNLKIQPIDPIPIKQQAHELAKCFFRSPEHNRELLVSLIERIELTENREILIYFKFKPLHDLA